MTLLELAEKCAAGGAPVSEATLSRIERGQQTPRPKLRSVLAGLLSIGVEDLEREAPSRAVGSSGSAA